MVRPSKFVFLVSTSSPTSQRQCQKRDPQEVKGMEGGEVAPDLNSQQGTELWFGGPSNTGGPLEYQCSWKSWKREENFRIRVHRCSF